MNIFFAVLFFWIGWTMMSLDEWRLFDDSKCKNVQWEHTFVWYYLTAMIATPSISMKIFSCERYKMQILLNNLIEMELTNENWMNELYGIRCHSLNDAHSKIDTTLNYWTTVNYEKNENKFTNPTINLRNKLRSIIAEWLYLRNKMYWTINVHQTFLWECKMIFNKTTNSIERLLSFLFFLNQKQNQSNEIRISLFPMRFI